MRRVALYVYRRNLPHWRLTGATYFVTWRLAATQRELASQERELVTNALRHFDRQRYDLVAYVVMNDHVHVLVTPLEPWTLQQLVHGWKSFSTHQLRQICGRSHVWQSEYFDRVVRDDTELLEKACYILQNPWKRWPELSEYRWVGVRE